MRRFKFNLENVLMLREHNLEDERIKLSKIVQKLNLEKKELQELTNQLDTLKKDSITYFQTVGYNASLIENYGQYVQKILDKTTTQQKLVDELEKRLKVQQETTKKAYIDLKTLESLKEKAKEKYNKEVLLEEIKNLDDIVNSRKTA